MKTLLKITALLISHGAVAVAGFAAGVYFLPILTAPPAPQEETIAAAAENAAFTAAFRRDLKGSDSLHWGEGAVFIGNEEISLRGEISPGPDYKLYLSPAFVETEADFLKIKDNATRVGDIKTFKNFILPLPAGINPNDYQAVVIWCETFSEFITAARYR